MIDKDILQMPKIKNFVLLAGFSFLQAVFIIGQVFFFQSHCRPFGGGHLNQQLQSILLFYFYIYTCIFVRECSIHLVMNAQRITRTIVNQNFPFGAKCCSKMGLEIWLPWL